MAELLHLHGAPDATFPRGTDVGSDKSVEAELRAWGGLVEFSRMSDTPREVARLLTGRSVVGWVQGRSEFGPRALGNRSILADPRPAENKTIINAMVKKREGYRPFALEEYAPDYFEVPAGHAFPYMVYVMRVRKEAQALLGAVTHVDGTARIQTVSRETNERYWNVIDAFRELTPILLNTSFNNHAEPIVDSVEDALACFLTTELDYLVVGDYLVKKRDVPPRALFDLAISLPEHIQLAQARQFVPGKGHVECYSVRSTASGTHTVKISKLVHDLLSLCDGRTPLRKLVRTQGLGGDIDLDTLVGELGELWSRRVIVLRPQGAAPCTTLPGCES